jgi:hypothetical protein
MTDSTTITACLSFHTAISEEERHCPRCEEFWPATLEFWKKSFSRTDALTLLCRACLKEQAKGAITQLKPEAVSKKCYCCDQTKLLTPDNWYRDATNRNGFGSQCKLCVNARLAARRKNPGLVRPRKPIPNRRSPKAKLKRCNTCDTRKPLTQEYWYVSRTKSDGFMSNCKLCEAGFQRNRRLARKLAVMASN